MKVIFLDIDGVLNAFGTTSPGREHALEPEMMERLDRVASETSAVAVLTTTWRLLYLWPETRDILVRHGLALPIVGETRDLWVDDEPAERARRREIEDWLHRHPVERYVVVDDLALYPVDDPHFVRTDEAVGLTEADAERVHAALA